ncbi:MAG: right-handed parallel beta-helix repeat-containing protein [Planctomycetes bacterium]|nr:right-handed parallel beta-helix repeat-containing protein [Planctomycetota bacterium]
MVCLCLIPVHAADDSPVMQPLTAKGAFLVSSDFNSADSMTAGIQEAVDSLPEGGGTVYVPEGVHVIRQQLKLKPGTTLLGAGRSSMLKKSPAFMIPLIEDAEKGAEYVVIRKEDVEKLTPGLSVSFRCNKNTEHRRVYEITRIEDNKIYILSRGQYHPTLYQPLSVEGEASMMHMFVMIITAPDCTIRDLDIDGSFAEQMTDEVKTGKYSYPALLCGALYPCHATKIKSCWVHDTAMGVSINTSTGMEIIDSEVYNCSMDGIHIGGSPWSKFINNKIYRNKMAGISFCYGNFGILVSGNHIFENGQGIKALGIGDPKRDTTADGYSIISNNLIYNNTDAGIASGQGPEGAYDFIITGNLLRNNHQARNYKVGPHQSPAGISLFNSKRCVITDNRCMDDQDNYSRALSEDATAGSKVIYTIGGSAGNGTGQKVLFAGQAIQISDAHNRESNEVASVRETAWQKPYEITLKEPLQHDYKVADGALAGGVKTQLWGIFLGGPESEQNVVSNNVCVGNGNGGILWESRESVVSGNVGEVVEVDTAKSLEENLCPSK